MVMSMPFQFIVRWVKSEKTGRYYYRLFIDGTGMGLANTRTAPISLRQNMWTPPGGSTAESNFNSEAGTRDAILMRLAETYMIRAEAYGRKGSYGMAVADINVLRERAAYKGGENRPEVCVMYEPQAANLPAGEKNAPYTVTASTYDAIKVTENHFSPEHRKPWLNITSPRLPVRRTCSSTSSTMRRRGNSFPRSCLGRPAQRRNSL